MPEYRPRVCVSQLVVGESSDAGTGKHASLSFDSYSKTMLIFVNVGLAPPKAIHSCPISQDSVCCPVSRRVIALASSLVFLFFPHLIPFSSPLRKLYHLAKVGRSHL